MTEYLSKEGLKKEIKGMFHTEFLGLLKKAKVLEFMDKELQGLPFFQGKRSSNLQSLNPGKPIYSSAAGDLSTQSISYLSWVV